MHVRGLWLVSPNLTRGAMDELEAELGEKEIAASRDSTTMPTLSIR
jgi:hypothetical protein